MKTTLKVFALSVALFGISNISFGQNTAEATAAAGARIITPITIENKKALEFGDIVAGANTVTVDPDGVRTGSNEDLFLSVGRIPQAAQFTVSGEKSLSYLITFAVVEDLTNGSDTMTLSAFTENAGGSHDGKGTIGTDGTDSFKVGATLTVADNQEAGVYEGSYTVTVAYE